MPTFNTVTLYKCEYGVRAEIEAESPAGVVDELQRREAEPDFWDAAKYIDDSAGPTEFMVIDDDGETVADTTVPMIDGERYAVLENAERCHEPLLTASRELAHNTVWYEEGDQTREEFDAMLAHLAADRGAMLLRETVVHKHWKTPENFQMLQVRDMPNALAPIINVIVINLAYLIVGVVIVEVVFVYPGLGQLLVDSVAKRDLPVVQAASLIFAGVYILMNLTADILSIMTNPRLMHPK